LHRRVGPTANSEPGSNPERSPTRGTISDIVHGGAILEIPAQVALACASRYARFYVVTLSVSRVLFRDIIHVREPVTFSASVNYTDRTSTEAGIRLDTNNIQNETNSN